MDKISITLAHAFHELKSALFGDLDRVIYDYTDSMKLKLSKISAAVCRREKTVLLLMILAFIIVWAAICLWKYGLLAYNGLDLAIFNQVFWNTLHGRFFASSIQGQSYLGDHAAPALLLLLPVYAAWPDPRMLLIIQAVALALPAWPLWLIARRRLAASSLPPAAVQILPLIVAGAWLCDPFVQNIALYEFHMLPFALLPLFLAIYEYDRDRKGRFLVYALLALLVREDVALVLGALGLLACLEKRSRFWRFVPLLLAAGWFLAALQLISRFAPVGDYKFNIYYAWLGATPAEMAWNAARHPLTVLRHVLTLANLELVIGFAMPFMFIVFLRPASLILAAGPLLQFVLGAAGGGELIQQLHYAVLFLPALFLAAIEGLRALPALSRKLTARGVINAPLLLTLLIVAGAVYSTVVLSPLPAVLARVADPGIMPARAAAAEELLERIPPEASVAAGYSLLPRLSSREEVYSLHYLFLGTSQFALTSYAVPPDNRFVALDTDDLLTYKAQFRNSSWAKPHYDGGFARLRRAVGRLVFSRDAFQLYDRRETGYFQSVELLQRPPVQDFRAGIELDAAGIESTDGRDAGYRRVRVVTFWSADTTPDEELAMRLRLTAPDGTAVVDRLFPLANGLVPTTELTGAPISGEMTLDLPELAPGDYFPEISLEKEDAYMIIDDIRSMSREIDVRESFGSARLPPLRL